MRALTRAAIGLVFAVGLSSVARADAWSGQGSPDAERARLLVDATYYPFSAMGKLQMAGQSFCSATLVGPQVILTAGHCLWNSKRKTWWKPQDIHFVAGYQRSSFVAHGQGVRYLSPLTLEHKAPDSNSIVNDWALIELDRPLGKQVGWLGLSQQTPDSLAARKAAPQQASPAFLAAYRSDRAHALSLQAPCAVTHLRGNARVMYSDCQVVHGSSGSALVAYEDGKFVVVGVVSARLTLRDRPAQTAVVSTWALAESGSPQAALVSGFSPQWGTSWARAESWEKGVAVLLAALRGAGGDASASAPDSLSAALRQGPAHDGSALPPIAFPELQKCRGDCASTPAPSGK